MGRGGLNLYDFIKKNMIYCFLTLNDFMSVGPVICFFLYSPWTYPIICKITRISLKVCTKSRNFLKVTMKKNV